MTSREALSRRTRIETFDVAKATGTIKAERHYPEEQGLKLNRGASDTSDTYCREALSRRTRIETRKRRWPISIASAERHYPEEQGLKPNR